MHPSDLPADEDEREARPWRPGTALRVVETHSLPHEAYLARMALECAGIDAVVADDHVIALHWLWSNLLGGVKVMVRDEDLGEACELLVAVRAAAPALREGEGEACPRCGSTTATSVYRRRRAAFVCWMVLGVPLMPMPRQLRCAACGYDGKPGPAAAADAADTAATAAAATATAATAVAAGTGAADVGKTSGGPEA